MKVVKKSRKIINEAVKFLNKGGIVVCPTDTVYGFLADAENKKAVEKIFKIKKRPKTKPLPVFVKNIKMAKALAQISKEQEKTLKKYWPGKFTFVLKYNNSGGVGDRPKLITKNGTIALRIPKYKLLNDLLNKINKPLAQTSVNISGQPPLTKPSAILQKFARSNLAILLIDSGNLKRSKPSKIIDLTKEKINILRK